MLNSCNGFSNVQINKTMLCWIVLPFKYINTVYLLRVKQYRHTYGPASSILPNNNHYCIKKPFG